jgi:hypothetical protein
VLTSWSASLLPVVVSTIRDALRGVTPQGLRSNQASRRLLATRLSWIKVSLDALRNKLLQEELAAKTWAAS